MSDKPLIGGTKWDQEGIEPAKAFWGEVEAYRKAINERVALVADKDLRLELLQLINEQGSSLLGLYDALHELEIIGLDAKRKRLDNGTTQTDAGTR